MSFLMSSHRAAEHADHVALGIPEHPERETLEDLLGTHQAFGAHAFGRGERLLDVGHRDVEGQVAFPAGRRLPNAPADPDAVLAKVLLTGDGPVAELLVDVELPVEEVAVEPASASPSLPTISKCTTERPIPRSLPLVTPRCLPSDGPNNRNSSRSVWQSVSSREPMNLEEPIGYRVVR